MRYRTPNALEMAVKDAAKRSAQDTRRAISGFYFHRLLCRVFSLPGGRFVLKGGQGMLARTVDARATRDIDLLFKERSLDAALEELKGAASKDLGDFMQFAFEGAEPIKTEDEYRSGLNVRFAPLLGTKRLQPVSIDLVVDEVPLEDAELMAPADRIEVEGIQTCDYLVYPVECALADKLCAMAERHEGRPSSRVKDLVDILVYASNCEIDGAKLSRRIARELGVRRLAVPERFCVPPEWAGTYEKQFTKLVSQTGLRQKPGSIGEASETAARLLDPALSGSADGKIWNPAKFEWAEPRRSETV